MLLHASEQEFAKDLLWFFNSGSVQCSDFHSPLFQPRAVLYEVFECFPLLTASHTYLHVSLPRILSQILSLSTTTLTLDLHCNPSRSCLFWIFYIFRRVFFNSSLHSSSTIFTILPQIFFANVSSTILFFYLSLYSSCIFWWLPNIYISYFSYHLPVFFWSPHYFPFLTFLDIYIEACFLLFLTLCCLFLSLLLL